MQGQIAYQRKQTDQALELLAHAADLARKAGGNRILAEIALELARIQRASNKPAEANTTLREGIEIARNMAERLLLPRLLAQLADLRVSERRYTDAAALLEEATDLLEGLLTHASSPWVRSRVIGGMNDVFLARITDGIGLVRVSMFPGILGMDVARDISRAVAELGCDRLVIDLRGNTGGGIGCLRLMSQLCSRSARRGI